MDFPAARRDRLRRLLDEEGLDALLITNPINVTYLTGFRGDSTYLVLERQKELLISDGRYAQQLAEECPGLPAHIRPPDQWLSQAAAAVLNPRGIRALGYESGHLTVSDFETLRELTPAIDWKPARDRVERLRMVKDPSEIEAIRGAIAVAEKAFETFRASLRPTDTEKELHDAMEMHVRRAGGQSTAFASIVAAGPRAALPHALPSSAVSLADAELLLVDWGARLGEYLCDLTRVLPLRRIAPKLEEVHAVVLTAQRQAIRAVRPGVAARDIDAEARAVIDQAGFGSFFTHGLGHGIGLQVHEAPAIRANSTDTLQAGMVFTIEPGIYLPGWGGVRLEDDVLVSDDGAVVLTTLTKELALLQCL
jgi:Xaa-Pro aminopeptidase